MEKAKRNERVAAIIRVLSQYPNQLFSLSYFCKMFGSAKSTISEDMVVIKELLKKYDLGELETVTGAAGGVRFFPAESREKGRAFVQSVCDLLSDGSRILPGGFLYTVDILSNPLYLEQMGNLLASHFRCLEPDFVATVETKGIPIALMVARALGKPLVIMRRDNKLTEGSVVTINYISASTSRMQTMSLSTRAVKRGQKALIIDDFMKGGGTVKAICGILGEFQVQVAGIGVVIATHEPADKQVRDYTALIELGQVDEKRESIEIFPSERFFKTIPEV